LLRQSSGLVAGAVRGVGSAAGLLRHGAANLGGALGAALRTAQGLAGGLAARAAPAAHGQEVWVQLSSEHTTFAATSATVMEFADWLISAERQMAA
jgi:hypothetical protein